MRALKRLLLASGIFLTTGITVVHAQNSGLPSIPNPSSYNTLEEIVGTVLGLVRPVVIITLIAVLMYGGWVRLTARENADAVANSSKIIVAALVGFAIIVLAPVLVEFFGSLLGVQGGLLDFSN